MIRTRVRSLACALLVLTAATSSVAGQAVELGPIAERLEAEATKILRETGIPSISVALVRDGDVAWTGAWGWANVAARVPATPETYYSTGSTFKFVTATAVMQLVEAGKLTLDTPLNGIVDSALRIEGADDVTLRHMLSHHSGLEGPVGTVLLWSRTQPRSVDSLLARTRRGGPPGVAYRYCNECYAIAGHVVEKLSGEAWDRYVAEHILKPLGVEIEQPSIPSPAVVEMMALPYGLDDNAAMPVAQVRYDVFAAGDAYLRPRDMARFLAAQLGDGAYGEARILEPASAREMRRQQFEGEGYGLGIGVRTSEAGRTVISHGGAIPGFSSFLVGEPAAGSGVYVMANAGGAGAAINALAGLAMQLLRGEDPPPLASLARRDRVAIEIDPAIFDAYVGEYRLRPDFTITVTRDGARFYVQATGQSRLEIFPETVTHFFMRVVEAQVTFGRDDTDGPVTHMILHQAGQQARAERIR